MTASPLLTGSYGEGTVSVTEGDTTVTLTGGLTTLMIQGDFFQAGKAIGVLDSVTDSRHFELALPWAGDTLSGADYQVYLLSPQRWSITYNGNQLRDFIARLKSVGIQYYVDDDSSEPDPGIGEEGNFAIKMPVDSAWLFWVKQSGVWQPRGSPIGINWQDAWVAGTAYFPQDMVTRLGSVYRALLGSTGKAPEANPTYWKLVLQTSNRFPVMWSDTDQPASGEVLAKTKFGVPVMFPAGMSASRAFADAGATTDAVFRLMKNGVEFATYTFVGDGTTLTAVYSCPADTYFNGTTDIFTDVAPAPRDATLRGVAATHVGYQ